MKAYLRLVIVALGIVTVACAEFVAPPAIIPFDATVQPTLAAVSTVSGAAGNEIVRVSVTIGNPDGAPRRYTLRQPCILLLRLYATPARAGTPVYADEWAPGGCKWFPIPDTLVGHASVTFTSASHPVLFSATPPSIQPLPAGRYYASVSVGVLELTPGSGEVPVGEVILAVP